MTGCNLCFSFVFYPWFGVQYSLWLILFFLFLVLHLLSLLPASNICIHVRSWPWWFLHIVSDFPHTMLSSFLFFSFLAVYNCEDPGLWHDLNRLNKISFRKCTAYHASNSLLFLTFWHVEDIEDTVETPFYMVRLLHGPFQEYYRMVERVGEYRPGGYHTVHLNDVFKQRFSVIGKLAYGQFLPSSWQTIKYEFFFSQPSRWWQIILASILVLRTKAPATGCIKDPQTRRIQKATKNSPSSRILKVLASNIPENSISSICWTNSSIRVRTGFICALCFHLWCATARISHMNCLVLWRRKESPMMWNTCGRFPKDLVRAGSPASVNIVHIDLKPATILFSTAGIWRYDELLRPPAPSPVERLEGVWRDDSASEYLVSPRQRWVYLDDSKTSKALVQISDLGGGKVHQIS